MGNSLSSQNVAAAVAAAVVGVQVCTTSNPIGRSLRLVRQFFKQEKKLTSSTEVNSSIEEYNRLHKAEDSTERNKQYKSLVNSYYDLATVFYEWGWCESFHFANQFGFETFSESIRRHEYYLVSKLGLHFGMGSASYKKVLDVGCGIGGPMRNIARFSGAEVTGITLNQYQVQRGNELSSMDSTISKLCRAVQGDFMNLPFDSESFDGAYAIEATCHAPDRVACYTEIYRVLKPGSIFACYEWCMTDEYDPTDPYHKKIKKQIEEGDGLPDIVSTHVCLDALKKAGFEILDSRDMANEYYGPNGKPWWLPLSPSWNPLTQRFQFNWLGMFLTKYSLKLMEFLWLAPKGTSKTQVMLQAGGVGCCQGGQTKIFTPMYLMVGKVPAKSTATVQ